MSAFGFDPASLDCSAIAAGFQSRGSPSIVRGYRLGVARSGPRSGRKRKTAQMSGITYSFHLVWDPFRRNWVERTPLGKLAPFLSPFRIPPRTGASAVGGTLVR